MDATELKELLTPEALQLLDELPEYSSDADVVAVVSALRKQGHPPGLVATVLTQSRLRRKARVKFGDFASGMLFTQAGLEQASRLEVAATHAGRFRDAGCLTVADLGCGLGADALAMAGLGLNVIAVERDEVTAALAAFNLSAFPNAEVRLADVTTVDVTSCDGIYLDPARRTQGHNETQRRLDPADLSPSLDFALSAAKSVGAGGIKLGPGMDRDIIPDDAEAQWVAVGDDVVEMGLWFGRCRRDGIARSALVISSSGHHEIAAAEDSPDAPVGELGEYLFEPNGAVMRARLVGDVARALSGHMIHPDIAYITGSKAQESPFVRGFRVLENLPLDAKVVSSSLASHGIGRVEVKKRGVDIDPATFRNKLTLTKGGDGVVILTRVGDKRRALVATRTD